MPVDRDGHGRPLAATERLHHLWRNFQTPHGLWGLDVGSELHHLLLPACVGAPCGCAAPPGSQRCGVPHETCQSSPPPRGRGPYGAACLLLRVGLVLSLGAVADVPDVAIRVGERSAVPAPLQLRRGLEDLPAGLLGLVQNFTDAVLAAHDVIEHDAAEAAALRAHAHHVGEPVAAVEADHRAAVWNEEHRDLVVVLDLPAQPFRIEALGPFHVIDAKQNRTDLRVHSNYPLWFDGVVTFVCCRRLDGPGWLAQIASGPGPLTSAEDLPGARQVEGMYITVVTVQRDGTAR